MIESPEFTCAGHKWELRLYPGGTCALDDGSVSESIDGYKAVCIDRVLPSEESPIIADFSINVNQSNSTSLGRYTDLGYLYA